MSSRIPNRSIRGFSCLSASVCFVVTAGQVSANDCQTLDDLTSYASVAKAPKDAMCAEYRGQGGNAGVACHWEFAFRSADAAAFAEVIWTQIQTCSAGEKSGSDAQVNHPDSYDLREWVGDENAYWVSVKDKGALNQTLVFVRYEQKN